MTKHLLIPLLKKHGLLCLAMSLIAALGIAILGGMTGFNRSMEAALYEYVEAYGYPDGVITVSPMERAKTEPLLQISGVAQINTRIFADTVAKTGNKYLSVRAFSRNDDDFARFYFWSRADEQRENAVWVEYNFAQNNSIAPGDTIGVRVNGRYLDAFVEAVVSTPECLSVRPTGSWGASPDFGYLYFSDSLLEGTGYENMINQILLQFDDNADSETVLAGCTALLGTGVLDSYTFADSDVQQRIDDNVDPIDTMCVFIPTVFFVVILGVLFLCFSILIRRCRRDIGILRALGFSIRGIRGLFSNLTLVISAVGVLLGAPICYFVIKVCSDYYRNFYPIPQLPYHIAPVSFALAILLTFAVAQLAAWAGSRSIASVRPVEAMSREVPRTVRDRRLQNTLLKHASPLFKFNMTTLLRNQKRFFFTVVCVAMTVMMLFCAVSFKASYEEIIRQSFDERIAYDCQFFLTQQPDEAFLDGLSDYVTQYEIIQYYGKDLRCGDRTLSVTVNALDPDTDLVGIPDIERLPYSGIVVDRYAADQLGVSAGDTVTLGGIELTVQAISNQYSNRIQYISREQATTLGDGEYGAVICRTEDETALMSFLVEEDTYLCSTFTDTLRQGIERTFDGFEFVVWLLIGFSVAIALVVVIAATDANLTDRKRELSVIRSQGFSMGQISGSWFSQSAIMFALSSLAGLPMGWRLAAAALSRVNAVDRSYPYASGMRQILVTLLITAIFTTVSHLAAMHSVRKWNLAANTKDGE